MRVSVQMAGLETQRLLLVLGLVLTLGSTASSYAQNAESAGSGVCNVRTTLGRVDGFIKRQQEKSARLLLGKVQRCAHLSQIDTFNIAWTYGKLGDYKTALKMLDAVSPDVPNLQTHAYAVAFSQFHLGDYAATVKTLKAVEQRQALDSSSANLLAIAYARQRQWQNAYAILRKLIEGQPKNVNPYLNMVALLANVGKYAEAHRVAAAGNAAFPRNAEMLTALGSTETLLGKLDEARSDFQSAIEVAPKSPAPRFYLALTDYQRNQYAEAEADLKTAAREGVVSPDLEYLMAECILKLDPTKPDEAIAELDKAIQLDANSVPARTLRGKLLLEGGKPQAAIADLQIAHRLDPTMRSAAYNLARAYFAVGKQKKALALYSQLEAQPADKTAKASGQAVKSASPGKP